MQPVYDTTELHFAWPGLQLKQHGKNTGVIATQQIKPGTCIPMINTPSQLSWSVKSPECITLYIKELYHKKANCIQHSTSLLVTKLIEVGEELTWCNIQKSANAKWRGIDDYPIMYA